MEINAPCLVLPNADNYPNFLSTGYLEDALIEFGARFKRRKLMVSSNANVNANDEDFRLDPLSTLITNDLVRDNEIKQKKKFDDTRMSSSTSKMVYPFGLVKPGGEDGDITLNDINHRILKPPTRPLKHPVGDFASRPAVSPHGPGLSGKAVVAFTKIHTQGRGTITIIRTKG
ncbi:hypothetical protein KSS87_023885 [Heliosperma pusillum]|nr:hypothetical protein KSS87_023885 [Heliosperma pusillum]